MKHLSIVLLHFFAIALSHAQTKPEEMENQKTYTTLVLLNATPQWLSLTREKRSEFFEKKIGPIFQSVSKTVKIRLFDSEYFHAGISDFMIIDTQNLEEYKRFIELLRDTKIYGEPYFEIKDIILGQEGAFLEFNELFKKEAR